MTAPPSTAPPPPVGGVLAANDDTFLLLIGEHTLAVAQNDQRTPGRSNLTITEVSMESGVASISAEGDAVVFDTGDSPGVYTFTYTISDGVSSDVASVQVVVTALASNANAIDGLVDDGADEASDAEDEDRTGILPSLRLPDISVSFRSLNLVLHTNPWLLAGVLLVPIAIWRFRRVSGWASVTGCLLYTSPSPRDATLSRMPSSA